ncbi:hypothetical protein SIM91_03825 [Rhodococcus opacus]|uniref:hypothetical protein n=1 Tax=Rhodococcus opacus TaxID=37919 RepID=UPI0007CD99C4|nr:hypothetical protein [Rhodococcus opacus]MDX5962470.1 hypothetical protein [Rhodococcus opacus]
MSSAMFSELLDLACGAFLLTAAATLWRHNLVAIVRLTAAQAVALAVAAVLIGIHDGNGGMFGVAAAIGVLNGVLLPATLRRVVREQPSPAGLPLVNVAASMVAAVLLTLLSYAVSRPVIGSAPTETAAVIPLALAVVFVGFFAVITRRPAIAQTVGFLSMVNGVMATALLTTGSAAIVTMTVSLDLLLWVWVRTMDERAEFDGADPDTLRQLRD